LRIAAVRLLPLFLLPTVFAPCPAADPKTEVAAQLKAYYDKGTEPPWKEAVGRLKSTDLQERADAAGYLVAVLTRALEDERSGAAPWRATPYWGSSGGNPARRLREAVAGEVAGTPGSPAALPVLRWFLDHEPSAGTQERIVTGLDKLAGKEADDFRLALLNPAHKNAAVVAGVLKQVGPHKTALPADRLAQLCHHYRASIREEARKLNRQRKGPDPGPFDAALAMRAGPVRELMDAIGKLIVEPPAADAKWVVVTTTYFKDGKKTEESQSRGWLLKDGDTFSILTPFADKEAFSQKARETSDRGKQTYSSSYAAEQIEKEVERLVELRKNEDREFELSRRGGLTGQFEGCGASLYEIMVGRWLYDTKQYDLAARVILPALDMLYTDEHLAGIVRDGLGQNYGYRMLAAFVGERDYDRATKLASLIRERFPGTRFHSDAVRLMAELPMRRDDFKELKLPTAKEWAELKGKTSRAEQVEYLCKRMRLLNCFQWGQPGDVSYSDKQYAEPCGMSRNASWGGSGGKTEVINPLVEFVGPTDGFVRGDAKRSKGMELAVADIRLLAPHLRDDWHLLIVSFWRDFHPDRTLHTSRPLFARLINDLAKRDLCDPRKFATLTDAERDKEIRRIVSWATANADKTAAELNWDTVREAMRAGKEWREVSENVYELIEAKEANVTGVLLHYLDQESTDKYDRRDILTQCAAVDAKAAKAAARRYLDHKDLGVQVAAASVLWKAGDKVPARAVLARVLAEADHSNLGGEALEETVGMLLADGSADSRQAAVQVFRGQRLVSFREENRLGVVKKFIAAGMPDGYRFYLPLLDIAGRNHPETGTGYFEPVRQRFASEIMTGLAPDDPEIKALVKAGKKPGDAIPELKKWLQKKIDEAPKKPEK
jgi:hypothetical protein